ncbi:LOW QUALITY PROTEIN: lysine-rich arabinogalactan protein 19-like [Melanaphis sacchari]|uniref:LOW QUALITY PROTEIN: lysine-rich arabinogalactan protein 19-like n=1 Tax=Melanaphis sacchari TaxID=742174 RepID=UPI000DC13F16|nr:LOW QUALITY PROTEIN: lysine-rich arabinogalactan protein 19-like [Melanaphis sacchari]
MNSSLLLFAAAVVAVVSGSAVYPAVHHAPVTTQYHSQDELGQYAYGYSGGPSSKHEQRTADGVTSGGYSYVDANGLVQSLAYVSDPVNGFRVSGTNLPADSNTVHHAALPVVRHAAVPVVHHADVPVVHHADVPVHHWAPQPAEHVVVKSPSYIVPAAHPLLKLAQPLTPAGTVNVHYPEHVVLAARKKRSAGLYSHPLVSGYTVAAPSHVVTVKHTEFAAPPAPVVHHLAPAPVPYYLAAAPAPAPVATSYTSVVRHHEPAAAPAHVVAYAAAPAPHVYAAARPASRMPPPRTGPTDTPPPLAVAVAVAVAPAKSQFHSQDEHGQYTYGYTDGSSAKTETRYADGETKGSYSYVDDHGAVQAVHYSAGADGFKAAGTNIPVHHV